MALIRAKAPKDYLLHHEAVLQAHENANVYDESLVEAVKDFQKGQGRKADGVIGTNTIQALQGETTRVQTRPYYLFHGAVALAAA